VREAGERKKKGRRKGGERKEKGEEESYGVLEIRNWKDFN
jgi:hypothetical protein